MTAREGEDDAEDVTLWAGRLRAWPAADPAPEDPPEDLTRVRRRTPPAEPDDTVLSPARTRPAASAPPSAARPAASDAEDHADATEVRPTRRRPDPDAPPRPPATSRARVPEALAREIYRPRAPEPVIAERRAPTPPPSRPLPAEPVRGRGRLAPVLVIAGGTLLAVAAAAVGLAVLLP